MDHKPSVGALVVSIDLPTNEEGQGRGAARSLLAAAANQGVACTWCSTQPAADAMVAQVLAENLEHEIALTARPQWLTHDRVRAECYAEIAQHMRRASSAGYSVTTLALPAGAAAESSDMAQKLGLIALRTTSAGEARARKGWFGTLFGQRPAIAAPQALRYRLWEVPATVSLPDARGKLRSLTVLRQAIDRAVSQKQTLHLVIDAAGIERSGASSLKLISKFLEYAAQHRLSQNLRIETIESLVTRLSKTCRQVPARSILRAA